MSDRKNGLFARLDVDGPSATAIYFLIETAKFISIDPEAYLREIPIERIVALDFSMTRIVFVYVLQIEFGCGGRI